VAEKPRLVGAYERGALVWLDYDNQEPIPLTWRQALTRVEALKSAEVDLPPGKREVSQELYEDVIRAAVAARIKTQPGWQPRGAAAVIYHSKRPSIVVP